MDGCAETILDRTISTIPAAATMKISAAASNFCTIITSSITTKKPGEGRYALSRLITAPAGEIHSLLVAHHAQGRKMSHQTPEKKDGGRPA
jgi:hypothetical protein